MSESALTCAFWQDRPTFVTGATGLVGGWLVERLVGLRASVVCLVRDEVPRSRLASELAEQVHIVRGDICDRPLLERAINEYECASVIHLAAQTIVGTAARNPVSTFESNIRGTWQLLEACRRCPTVRQVVVASSDKAYGEQGELPYTEEMPLTPLYPYDVSKACADLIAQSYARVYGVPVVISRCGNFYGGGDLNWNRLIPGTLRSIIRHEAPVLRSDGSFVRDYLYVKDGASAYTVLIEQLASEPNIAGQVFNFSCESPVDALTVVHRLLELTDSSLEPVILNQATNEIPHQFLSAAKARRVLGWQPAYDLTAGLRETISWYERYFGESPRD